MNGRAGKALSEAARSRALLRNYYQRLVSIQRA
jgi:hypothetical protein